MDLQETTGPWGCTCFAKATKMWSILLPNTSETSKITPHPAPLSHSSTGLPQRSGCFAATNNCGCQRVGTPALQGCPTHYQRFAEPREGGLERGAGKPMQTAFSNNQDPEVSYPQGGRGLFDLTDPPTRPPTHPTPGATHKTQALHGD